MNKYIISIIDHVCRLLAQCFDEKSITSVLAIMIASMSKRKDPKSSMRILLLLEKRLYEITSMVSCLLEGGIHSKHRVTRYHEYFCSKISENETVLDIGCGNGALTFDLAKRGAIITGIDLNENNIDYAKKKYQHNNITYIHGDALRALPLKTFDTIIMSNVLEHVDDRIQFLRQIQINARPRRFLIRVPMYEREWRVPLMDELGVDSRLDPTHAIEYREDQLVYEIERAGLEISEMQIHWGEYWCEVHSKD